MLVQCHGHEKSVLEALEFKLPVTVSSLSWVLGVRLLFSVSHLYSQHVFIDQTWGSGSVSGTCLAHLEALIHPWHCK